MPVVVHKKLCRGPCGEDKPLVEFYRNSGLPDGRMNTCKPCTKLIRADKAKRRQELAAQGVVLPPGKHLLTDEERRQRSEMAKRQVAEGRFGGAEYGKLGGRSRKARVNDKVLDYFRQEDKSDLIVRAFESSLRSASKAQRLKAAEALLALEQRDEEVRLKLRGGGKDPEQMTEEELQEFVAQALTSQIRAGNLDLSTITLPDSAVKEVA